MSNSYHDNDFGVRNGSYGRRFVCCGAPGVGFMEHDSDSITYVDFVTQCRKSSGSSYWNMLTEREPGFDRERKRIHTALASGDDPFRKQILENYDNALAVAKQAEHLLRIEQGIKDKMGHRHHRKYFVSVIGYYRRKMERLAKDMCGVELNLRDTCTEAQYEAWLKVAEAFEAVAACRRVWHDGGTRRHRYNRVFFDLGVFDYIKADAYLPLMRTHKGPTYYILPTCVIAARDNVDFEVHPLSEVSMVCNEMSIQEPIDIISSELGDAASILHVPAFGQTWFLNHVRPVAKFVAAYDALRGLQNEEQ